MRNENKFSTQKVREIFLIRAPPFFLLEKQKQNSFCAETKLVRERSGYGNNYKITILLFIKEKNFLDHISSLHPKNLTRNTYFTRMFFLRGEGRESSVHARTNNTILFVILGYYGWNARTSAWNAYGFYTQDGIRDIRELFSSDK